MTFMQSVATEHIFNDDLLANPADVAWIERTVPRLTPVLDFPELRQAFGPHDREAIQARRQTRFWGLLAIVCAVAALLATATEPLWGGKGLIPRIFGTGTELVGLLGAIVGAGGVWLGPSRRRWLVNRIAAERIRQWHFHFLVYRGDLVRRVTDEVGDEEVTAFRAERLRLFDDFLSRQRGKWDSLLTSLVATTYESEARLLEPAAGGNHGYADDQESFDSIAQIYRHLRLRHQLQYALYNLQTSTDKPWRKFLFWPPIVQERILGSLGATCMVLALIVSAAIILGHVVALVAGNVPLAVVLEHTALNSLAVALAVVAIAVRTLEDGLAIRADIDRYQHYAGRIQGLLREFDASASIRSRLHVMRECEKLCFEEMREFLVAHHQTRFIF
jgi:hypothetical protein